MPAEHKPLDPPDDLYLTAAEGWLELGNWLEANEELERISPAMRGHPFVLRLRWGIYAKVKKWGMAAEVGLALAEMLPDNSWGFIHSAYWLKMPARQHLKKKGFLTGIRRSQASEILGVSTRSLSLWEGDRLYPSWTTGCALSIWASIP